MDHESQQTKSICANRKIILILDIIKAITVKTSVAENRSFLFKKVFTQIHNMKRSLKDKHAV